MFPGGEIRDFANRPIEATSCSPGALLLSSISWRISPSMSRGAILFSLRRQPLRASSHFRPQCTFLLSIYSRAFGHFSPRGHLIWREKYQQIGTQFLHSAPWALRRSEHLRRSVYSRGTFVWFFRRSTYADINIHCFLRSPNIAVMGAFPEGILRYHPDDTLRIRPGTNVRNSLSHPRDDYSPQ